MLLRPFFVLLCAFPFFGVPAEIFADAEKTLDEKIAARNAELDKIYAPDPFDPEIPFLPEKTPNAAVDSKREAYVSKLPAVSKYKEKARPEAIDRWFMKIMPTATDPVALSNRAKLRTEIREKLAEYERVPADKVFAHPSAKFFPGDVPEKFRRVSAVFYAGTRTEGWQSTGLYAAPGERVKVHVSQTGTALGLRIRIGCHTDNLLDSRQRYWYRFPKIVREFRVSEQSFEIASPFGGLIYVSSPRAASQRRMPSRTQFKFSGVVEAPFFVLGSTKPQEWNQLRYAPAPWAEFVGENFIATIPADEAAAIDNPETLIRFWDGIVAELDKLTARAKRERPERFVVDIETGNAVGHGGNPIVGNLLWSRTYWDLEQIRADGSWGLFRALGENSLNGKWIFRGDRDTPSALLAAFCMEKATGRKAASFFDLPALHAAAFARVEREKIEEKDRKAQRDEQRLEKLKERRRERPAPVKKEPDGDWKGRREREEIALEADVPDERADPGKPFQKLAAYLSVVDATGWKPVAKMFKLYTVRNQLQLATEEDKQRTFVMLWSQTTKKNLSPFLEKFDFARQGSAVKYPAFSPENFPPDPALRPAEGGTGFLGKSPFPTIAAFNSDYRVKQLPPPESPENGDGDTVPATQSAFGETVADADENDVPADSVPAENSAETDENVPENETDF